jgi:hypothetical protein
MTPFLRWYSLLLLPGALFVLFHAAGSQRAILERTNDTVRPRCSLINEQSVWSETAPVLDTTEIPQWIQDYIDYHKISMAKAMNGTTDVNHYLIYTCKKNKDCSGTGDRNRAINAMFIVAVLTKRILLIDMDNPVPLSQILEPHLINWKDIPKYVDDLPSEFLNILERKPPPLNRPQDFAIGVKPQVVRVLANHPAGLRDVWNTTEMQTHLAAYTEPEPQNVPSDIYKIIFYSLFRPTTALTRTVQEQRHMLGLNSAVPYVAMHVRAGGDWGGWKEKRYKVSGLLPFYKTACSLVPGNETPIVVISDTLAAKTALHAIDPDRVRFVKDMILVHEDKVRHRESPVSLQASLNVWSDILILAQSKCLVMSRSSFSRLASRISEVRGQPRCQEVIAEGLRDFIAKKEVVTTPS